MPPPLGVSYIFTAADPGIFGDLIVLDFEGVPGGPGYASSLAGTTITLQIGTTAGATTLDWAAIANLFNADATVNFLGSMDGQPGDNAATGVLNFSPLDGGTDGSGAGQYYFAGVAPPPVEIEVNIIFCGVVRFLVRDRAQNARQAFRQLGALALRMGAALLLHFARRLEAREQSGRAELALGPFGGDKNVTPDAGRRVLGQFAQPVAQVERETKDLSVCSPFLSLSLNETAVESASDRCSLGQFAQPVAQTLLEANEIAFLFSFRSPRSRFAGQFSLELGRFAQPVAQTLLEAKDMPVFVTIPSPLGERRISGGVV